MSTLDQSQARKGLSDYFSASHARVERWRTVHRLARSLAAGGKPDALRTELVEALQDLAPIEDLCGYPGPGLMAALTPAVSASSVLVSRPLFCSKRNILRSIRSSLPAMMKSSTR